MQTPPDRDFPPGPRPEPTFGTWLRSAREALGLTRAELAEATGVSWATLHNLELGHRLATPEQRSSLVAALAAVDPTVEPPGGET